LTGAARKRHSYLGWQCI